MCALFSHESIASAEEQIIDYLEKSGTVRNREGRALTGIESENAMKRVFERMRKNEIIEPVDPNATRGMYSYRLMSGYKSRFQTLKDRTDK